MLIADFLDETSIESAILDDIARIIMARAQGRGGAGGLSCPQTDAIMLFHDLSIIGEPSFSRAPRCRGVVRAGVGYNNVDVEAATRHGVIVCNVPDYGTEEVADHAIMFLLAIVRRLVPSHQAIRAGTWDYRSASGAPRLRGKTFGVVGCGRIGTAAALRAKALGLDVVFYDPFLAPGDGQGAGIRRVYQLDDLLEQSHFVSLHCYLDATNRHLINAQTIARMRPGAVLINTARGPLVDEQALLDALDSGHIAAAGLDVVETEPLENERLRQHPNILLTPHTAFYSVEGYNELRTKTAEEVRRILLGEPPRNPVNAACCAGIIEHPENDLHIRNPHRLSRPGPGARLAESLQPLAELALGGDAYRRVDRGFELPVDPPISGTAERLVVGPGLLQPVVLGVDEGRWDPDRPTDLGLCPGRAVGLEDELPGSDPAGACAALRAWLPVR